MSTLMKNCSHALLATAAAFSVYATTSVYAQQPTDKGKAPDKSMPADKSKSSAQPAKKTDDMTVFAPVLMLVPLTVSTDSSMNKGCWAKLYEQKNFQGDSFTLVGPIDWSQMTGPFGTNWENKIRSLETGPKARVTIYDNRNFKDQDKAIAAAAKVPDLSKQMGFFDDFRSMKISCS